MGNLVNLRRAGDRSLQFLILNEEFLVSASHQLALITSLPFVHTAKHTQHLLWGLMSVDFGTLGEIKVFGFRGEYGRKAET